MPTKDEFKEFNRPLIEAFRANAGQVEGWQALLLVTSQGAKSGKPHTTPLAYSLDGDRIIIVAAAAGAPRHPDWYRNLLVHPVVTVERGGERLRMRAVVADGEEYARLFKQHSAQIPELAEYQEITTRRIPIIILERMD